MRSCRVCSVEYGWDAGYAFMFCYPVYRRCLCKVGPMKNVAGILFALLLAVGFVAGIVGDRISKAQAERVGDEWTYDCFTLWNSMLSALNALPVQQQDRAKLVALDAEDAALSPYCLVYPR